ncbi:major tail protein [Lacticaseibacillus brantae]|uniref:Prophage LambdaBa04, major tail protein n=1 Tax=Lacticaseibacillus brantae DSM 23927 TaxID=1423727 RepID=A0A0R2B1A3_9LACO|nr:major tail protein [Lacticaseibacillus brantae]KRM73007.1 prophage LambdaBa04, major tail protein [Lacticaseibacillus brantae DSM 23927]
MATNQENRVEFGLKNAHYALVTDTGTELTYAAPKKLPGAVKMTIDAEGGSDPFYADDTKYYTAVSNQGYSGKFEIARITDEFMQEIFGEKVDETTGMQYDDTDANPKQFALMFEFDGDVQKTRRVLFNVTATRPSIESETKADKTSPNTTELEFTAAPDPYAARAQGKVTQGKPAYDGFFDAVVIPGAKPTAPTGK